MTVIASDMSVDNLLLARTHHPPAGTGFGDIRSLNHQRTSPHTSSKSRRSIATLAKEKTSAALANLSIATQYPISSTPLRLVASNNSLSQQQPSQPRSGAPSSKPSLTRSSTASSETLKSTSSTDTIVPCPPMAVNNSKMHQTSSKILRMTDDDRPFTRDFKDLFATLITSLPMQAHRVRFSKVEETFTSEEAITNLGSLKFSQSNRIPDPKTPTRWVVTTTTTTFSMAKEMARSVCQRFVDARLIESAEQKVYPQFPARGAIWQLTPKGKCILRRFCDRNGVEARHIESMIRRPQMNMVSLERDSDTDKLIQDKSTVEVIFRRFAGIDGPNLKSSIHISDSDSVSEYSTGLVGVKMAKDRRIGDRTFNNTFTGKAASDWLLDCCTTIDRRETFEICDLFVRHSLILPVVEDRAYARFNQSPTHFQPTRNAIYRISERGQNVCGWAERSPSRNSEDSKDKSRLQKDTNMNRLNAILSDAALRMLFKEHLRASLCEENLNFYLDAHDFIDTYHNLEKGGKLARTEPVRETLATAYGLYNSFLASGAPSELNMDHALRNKLDSRMTQTDSDETSMQDTLKHVVELIELASASVFKLMATDSVPKFIRDPKYQQVFREHDFDVYYINGVRASSPAPAAAPTTAQSPQTTLSRSNTRKRNNS